MKCPVCERGVGSRRAVASLDYNRTADKDQFRTISRSVTSFLIVAAAGIWLAACSGVGDRGPAAAPPSATTPAPTTAGRVSTPAAGSPVSPSGTATTSASPNGATTSAGGGSSSSSSPAAASGAVKPKTLTVSDQGQGGVTVKATWVIPGSPEASSAQLDRNLAFKVTLDTHSGDLTKYNVTKLSILRDDKGKEITGADWKGTSEDSHHREGILSFPKGAEQGSKYVELVVRDLGGIKERVLRWEVGS